MTRSQYVLANFNTDPPAAWTYWVVEGKLLAGPYPGSADTEGHRNKIQTLLNAGVTNFVNLMEEAESNWGGKTFVPYDRVARELTDVSLDFQRFAIPDGGIPEPGFMASVLHVMDESILQGRAVYVHCWGGVGRTGTVVGCWMLRHGLATPDDVLTKLARLRTQDKVRGHRVAPETPEQRRFVKKWPS
jgi:protein-tyrosine phosphatase